MQKSKAGGLCSFAFSRMRPQRKTASCSHPFPQDNTGMWKTQSTERLPHGNQLFQLDPELKPSPVGGRFPPRRGKCRAAPDEGYLGQNAVVLRPHQSPAVTASPDRGKPSCGKLISMRLPSGLQNKKDVLPCGNTSFFIASVSGGDQLTAGGRQRPEPCRARCPRTS